MENFTEEEKKLLSPFVSNLDKDVFVLRNLPEVVKGALFSKYSRSAKGLRRTLLDEFILKNEGGFAEVVQLPERHSNSSAWTEQIVATKKAEEFYDRVLVGFGDDSVAELAGAHLAMENISIIATKVVEDARIGLSPLEKSTRYVYFDQKVNGQYRFLREPALMASKFAEEYVQTCDFLFDTYTSLIPEISKYLREKMPKEEKMSERAYDSIIRAKTCDVLRGLLPASTLTNMGFFGNGRAYEYLITKMYADPLSEIRALAGSMQEELRTVIPAFVKRPDSEYGKKMQLYISSVREEMEKYVSMLSDTDHSNTGADAVEVTLVDYDKEIEGAILAAVLYPYTSLSLEKLRERVATLSKEEVIRILRSYIGKRENRRHKPGRAFEESYYTFDICTNYGAYRDIHRHRVLTQQRQLLGCRLGYTLPHEITEAGCNKDFAEAMERAKNTWMDIAAVYPKEAQYVVPLAYRIRWMMKMNIREAYHFCELRSAMQGHVDYRIVAQKIFEEIKKIHPSLAESMTFVDMDIYEFERLEAEKNLDKRIEEMERKYKKSK